MFQSRFNTQNVLVYTQCCLKAITFHALMSLTDTLFLVPCITEAPSVVVTHMNFCVCNFRFSSMNSCTAPNIVEAFGVPMTRTMSRNFVTISKLEKSTYLTIRMHCSCVDLSRAKNGLFSILEISSPLKM